MGVFAAKELNSQSSETGTCTPTPMPTTYEAAVRFVSAQELSAVSGRGCSETRAEADDMNGTR